jgi:hypothetical protein
MYLHPTNRPPTRDDSPPAPSALVIVVRADLARDSYQNGPPPRPCALSTVDAEPTWEDAEWQ